VAPRSRKLLRREKALQSLRKFDRPSNLQARRSRALGRTKSALKSSRTQVLSKSKPKARRYSKRLHRARSGRASAALRSLVQEPAIVIWEDCQIGNWQMAPRC
jgi:hypothetical protein